MSSWPAFFAAALTMWLLLKGPGAKTPFWVQKICRAATAFLLYSGFLYLVKWNTFWKWILPMNFENRDKAEGFLILISTLFWVVATVRIFLRRLPIPAARSRAPENPSLRQEKARRRFTLTDLILFYHFFNRK